MGTFPFPYTCDILNNIQTIFDQSWYENYYRFPASAPHETLVYSRSFIRCSDFNQWLPHIYCWLCHLRTCLLIYLVFLYRAIVASVTDAGCIASTASISMKPMKQTSSHFCSIPPFSDFSPPPPQCRKLQAWPVRSPTPTHFGAF